MIRRARKSDYFSIIALQAVCLPHDDPLDPDTGVWWVVDGGSGLAAFAALHPSQQWGDTQYLSRAGVAPEFRGKGLQRDLIRVRLRYARRLRANWCVSDTSDNPASANNLIACGFTMFRPTRPWGLPTSLYWKRKL